MAESAPNVEIASTDEVESNSTGFTPAASIARARIPANVKADPVPILGSDMYSIGDLYAREVHFKEFNGFFDLTYSYLTTMLYRKRVIESDALMGRQNFIVAMNYALQMRLFAVADPAQTADLVKSSIPYRREFIVPKAVATLINNVGRAAFAGGEIRFIPYPSTGESAELLKSNFPKIATLYRTFANLCRTHGGIPMEAISDKEAGTKFWLLDVLDDEAATDTAATVDTPEVRIRAPYCDFSPTEMKDAAFLGAGINNTKFFPAWKLGTTPPPASEIEFDLFCLSTPIAQILEDRTTFIENA